LKMGFFYEYVFPLNIIPNFILKAGNQ